MNSQPQPFEITSLLHRARDGDPEALHHLLPLVYAELHRLAASQMRRDFSGITLQPTALIHEAFLRIFGNAVPDFHDRTHFLGIVSRVMRQVLVDHARARRAQKRDPGIQIPFDDSSTPAPQSPADLLVIDEAMNRLAAERPTSGHSHRNALLRRHDRRGDRRRPPPVRPRRSPRNPLRPRLAPPRARFNA